MEESGKRIVGGARVLRPTERRIDVSGALRLLPRRTKEYPARSLTHFLIGQSGAVAIESAIAISVLVAAFAGLMAIVQESYATDRVGRAARAVARAVALDSQADPCAAIRRELGLAADFDCESQWRITVDLGVSPSGLPALLAGTAPDGAASGELILVRIGWKQESSGESADSETETDTVEGEIVSADGSDSTDSTGSQADLESVPMVAMGVARSEPESG